MTVNLAGQFDANAAPSEQYPVLDPGRLGERAASSSTGNQLEPEQHHDRRHRPRRPGRPCSRSLVKGDFIFIGTVPEPGTALLLGHGPRMGLVARVRRRRRRTRASNRVWWMRRKAGNDSGRGKGEAAMTRAIRATVIMVLHVGTCCGAGIGGDDRLSTVSGWRPERRPDTRTCNERRRALRSVWSLATG